jgi:hypothetical protein
MDRIQFRVGRNRDEKRVEIRMGKYAQETYTMAAKRG